MVNLYLLSIYWLSNENKILFGKSIRVRALDAISGKIGGKPETGRKIKKKRERRNGRRTYVMLDEHIPIITGKKSKQKGYAVMSMFRH